jgi:hypothetical protein
MGAAAEIGGGAVLERRVRGLQGRPDRMPCTRRELRRPGKAESALLIASERAPLDAVDPVLRVREQQLLARRRAAVADVEAGLLSRALAQQRVLAERKAMALRERIDEAVVRVAAQDRGQPGRLSPPSATRACPVM